MSEDIKNDTVVETEETGNPGDKSGGNPPPKDEMAEYAETITDASQKKAFLSTLKDGKFDKDAVKNLTAQYLSERRKLSRMNELPDSIEAYKESYKPDSKFANLFNEENPGGEKIRTLFAELDKMSLEKGFNADKNAEIKNFILDQFTKENLIDTRTKEEKEAAEIEKAEAQKTILTDALGDNIDLTSIDSRINQFAEDEADGDEETKLVFDAIKSTAKGKLILYSLMNRIYGKPVPVLKAAIGNSKKSLENEYNNPSTTRERRKEIAEQLNKIED